MLELDIAAAIQKVQLQPKATAKNSQGTAGRTAAFVPVGACQSLLPKPGSSVDRGVATEGLAVGHGNLVSEARDAA